MARWRTVGAVVVGLLARPASVHGQSCDSAQVSVAPVPAGADATDRARSVLTGHNDNARTGAYLVDTVLSTATVCPGYFGKLFIRKVDGQIYAQPLYVSHL